MGCRYDASGFVFGFSATALCALLVAFVVPAHGQVDREVRLRWWSLRNGTTFDELAIEYVVPHGKRWAFRFETQNTTISNVVQVTEEGYHACNASTPGTVRHILVRSCAKGT